jgi:GNAT superfamily N-acetyltransferase
MTDIATATPLRDGTHVTFETTADDRVLTIRARDDAGRVVGQATCDLAGGVHPRAFDLVVAEGARGNGVGTALFEQLLVEAGLRDIAWLTFTGPVDDALLRLAASSGSICARRVTGNVARSVVLVPDPAAA